MSQNNLAFSLIFKIVDGVSAKIREITQIMSEPADAAEKLGDATEKSGERQVSAFRKAKDALNDFSQSMTKPAMQIAALGKAAGEAAQKFSNSFAGMGAVVAEGFSIKSVAAQEDFFRRLQINTDMAKSSIEELRDAISRAAENYGVGKSKMVDAFQAYRANGGDVEVFKKNADAMAATLQLTGMDAEHAGQLFATMQNKMHITKPQEFTATLAQMRQQLKGIPDGMDAAAEASGRLAASMESLHMHGAQGMLALNAVYAVAARSSGGNARVARSATDSWITQLADRGYQNRLSQGLGERITDANGYVMDPRIIMQKMAAKYAWAQSLPKNQQVVAEQRLNDLFGEDAARMFRSVGGEIKATGHSKTIDQVLGAQGNSADFMNKAQEASQGLSGSMERLKNAMDRASESVFAKPIDIFAHALNACNGIVGQAVVGLAALVAVGKGITWIDGAIAGFKLLTPVLGMILDMTGGLVIGLGRVVLAMVPVIASTVGWTVALLANPVTWIVLGIVAAIAVLAAGVYWLSKHWKAAWGTMPGPVKFIGDTIGAMWDGAKKMAGAFFDYCSEKLKWVSETFGRLGDWVSRKMGFGGNDQPAPGASDPGAAGGNGSTGSPQNGAGGSAHGHNVGNLRNVHGAGFQAFADDRTGALAMARQLMLYANRDHLHSISQIVHKYAPPNENRTAAYIADVSRRMGISATASMNLNDRGTLSSLMHAMIHNEQGHDIFSIDQLGNILAEGGPIQNLSTPGSSAQGAALASATRNYPIVPATIYGDASASNNLASAGSVGSSNSVGSTMGDSRTARAHLTVEIKDGRRVKSHLTHSPEMATNLDHGPAMAMSWG